MKRYEKSGVIVFKLMLVTDRRASRLPIAEAVRRAVAGGVDAVQLRERDMEPGELFALADRLRRITREAGAALIINHRADIALAVGADGVQLGWRSLGVEDVRALAGGRLRIGVSCHCEGELHSAEEAGADYAILGPVFFTPSKQGLIEPMGVDRLRETASGTDLPLIAIGGIRPENVAAVRGAGVVGVAVISAIMASSNPREAAHRLAHSRGAG